MRAPQNNTRGSLEFNMTPMIDVTFLLIIFFLLSSHLAKQEVQLALDLPTAASGRESRDEAARRLTINVRDDGQLFLGSEPLTLTELESRIAFEARRHDEELEVRLRCDRQARYEAVEPVLSACARHGLWNVTFAVVERAP